MWQIQDDNGVIHTGDEETMRYIFDVMSDPDNWNNSVIEQYNCDDVKGDLQLVQVIATV